MVGPLSLNYQVCIIVVFLLFAYYPQAAYYGKVKINWLDSVFDLCITLKQYIMAKIISIPEIVYMVPDIFEGNKSENTHITIKFWC